MMTKEQIDQLKQQLNEKLAEVKEIYNQLVEAGEAPLPDDILDSVGGGGIGPTPTCCGTRKKENDTIECDFR